MKAKTLNLAAIVIAAAIVLLATVLLFKPLYPAAASTSRGSEYQGTTTQSGFQTENSIQNVGGTFGSVIIMATGTAVMSFYDATTSDITKRAASMSTSSILLGTFPASAAVGTYTFDRNIYNGLYVSIGSGTIASSTFTYRQ